LWFLILIGVMINIHEAGHYFAARWFDVKIDAFSFGFGTRLFGFRRGETDFRFSAIPFGGYVKMAGELAGDESVQRSAQFPLQAALAAADYRFRRSVHEHRAGGGHPDRHVHGEIRPVGERRDRPRDGRFAGRQSGHSGWRPDRPLDGQDNPTWEDVEPKEATSARRPCISPSSVTAAGSTLS
jgi:membrane-associated protease RseP (regulator of RpoE activity)